MQCSGYRKDRLDRKQLHLNRSQFHGHLLQRSDGPLLSRSAASFGNRKVSIGSLTLTRSNISLPVPILGTLRNVSDIGAALFKKFNYAQYSVFQNPALARYSATPVPPLPISIRSNPPFWMPGIY